MHLTRGFPHRPLLFPKSPNHSLELNHHLIALILEKPPHGNGLGYVHGNLKVEKEVTRGHVLDTNPTRVKQVFEGVTLLVGPFFVTFADRDEVAVKVEPEFSMIGWGMVVSSVLGIKTCIEF
jgi:hypothetical protein